MQAAARPYVMAAAALAATSVVAVTPSLSRPFELPIRSIETRLVDATDSIFNIPLNLFYDFVNIPYNEVNAMNDVASSFFQSGTWWVTSASNLWGTDPGDPAHYSSILNVISPMTPTLDNELGAQLAGLAAAELPVSSSCDAEGCLPLAPVTPLTGITGLDRDIWAAEIFTGKYPFPLIDDWLKVPLADLINGYNFGTVTDPSGPVYPFGDIPGTGGTPSDPTMPWSGTTFTLNLAQPFQDWFHSLMAAPPTDGIGGTGIEAFNFTDAYHAFIALLAGAVVDFDPFVPGSPACPGDACGTPDNFFGVGTTWGVEPLVKMIQTLDPTNPMINEWLTAVQDGTANGPTAAQVEATIAALQQGFFDGPNNTWAPNWELLQELLSGTATYPPPADATDASNMASATAVNALNGLLGGAGGASEFTNALSADWSALLSSFDAGSLSADLSALAANWAAMPADFSTLWADLLSAL